MPKAAMNTRSSRSELVDDEAMDIDELTHVARRESIVRDFNDSRSRCTKVFRERANGFASNCESLIARSMASGNQRAIARSAPRLLRRSKLPLLKRPQFRILAQENAFDPVERKFTEHLQCNRSCGKSRRNPTASARTSSCCDRPTRRPSPVSEKLAPELRATVRTTSRSPRSSDDVIEQRDVLFRVHIGPAHEQISDTPQHVNSLFRNAALKRIL